ncbi:O-fucosyltransferase 15 isoform X2 [Diospyros lotus]|uniref:O-fucosyltransferase 15 isoform X2 n=1 Tax=Diospyros lotus TaxID=55363 RepID=UPI002258658B|nr:O-fucosyltransferase 15 isoform X2 [Diospyros lotus]
MIMASTGESIEPEDAYREEGEGGDAEIRASDQTNGWASSIHARPVSSSTAAAATPRSSLGSHSSLLAQSQSSSLLSWFGVAERVGFVAESKRLGKRRAARAWYRRKVYVVLAVIGLLACFLAMNWWMISQIQDSNHGMKYKFLRSNSSTLSIREELKNLGKVKKPQKTIYARLLAKAAHALAENKREPRDLWEEPYILASAWRPCADQRDWEPTEKNNGYILVSANGGINQQRVAVCNAVAVSRLLNATLVVPKFLYSSVWRDISQFSDIYQEEHFINYLKPDIPIVKELPVELQSLDLEAIGSVVTDADIVKEAKPSFYLKFILPILHRNKVVHFVGFGNRLSSDPLPFQLQRLRCRCNFHALHFVPKIQEAGALLLQRMRHRTRYGELDPYLVGPFAQPKTKAKRGPSVKDSRYLALHLRFEIDMVAHSLCYFGGGEEEKRELEAYREIHFPGLTDLKKTTKVPSPAALRAEGLCPLMPEETVLMLAGLGFNRKTHIFLAGAHIYGGKSRLAILNSLYPNLVTKENLLSSSEIAPFMNFSSQLAALDFIACTAADVFAMTDSGSQLSSLVSGYRVYYGGGRMPTIRPNKRRLADIFLKNDTMEWKVFEGRVRKAVRQTKRIRSRPVGRSVYRYPRCKECMCLTE